MKIGSLFSGVGGLELGLEWAGLGETVWQVEKDEYCRSVLATHWPNAARYDSVEDVGARNLQPVDLICGGFPCQDVSSAGSGAGLAGARSGLWWEFARVVGEMRPAWVVVENVASGASRWLDAVRGELERLGYETLPVPFGAMHVGAPHRRRRVFLVGRLVADTVGDTVRLERQRRPARRSGSVCPPGDAVAADHGQEGDATWFECSCGHVARIRLTEPCPGCGAITSGADWGQAPPHADRARPQGAVSEQAGGWHGPPDGGAVPDADGGGREGVRLEDGGAARPPGGEPDRRRGSRAGDGAPRGEPAHDTPWQTEPGVCGVAHGPSTKLDRARLRALGNGVVPQCAQVVGEVINLLIAGKVSSSGA